MGRRSHTQEHGGQGTLKKRRADLERTLAAEDELEAAMQETLEEAQAEESTRRARSYMPKAVDALYRIIQGRSERTTDSVRISAIKLMNEIAYPKLAALRDPKSLAAGGTRVNFQVNHFGAHGLTPRQVTVPAIPVKTGDKAAFDAELDG